MSNSTNAECLLQQVELRRQELYLKAKALAENWFGEEKGVRLKTRYYSPDIRMRSGTSSGETISISWKRRYPVNGWKGKMVKKAGGGRRLVKVMHEHVAARKTGPAYPVSCFKDASNEELMDIMALEAELAPIRKELAFLGKVRRSLEDFYQTGRVLIEPENSGDFPEIHGKAYW